MRHKLIKKSASGGLIIRRREERSDQDAEKEQKIVHMVPQRQA